MSPQELLGLVGALTRQRTDAMFADLATRAAPTVGPAPDRVQGFRMRVDLVGARPPVWRRLDVPGNLALPRLHTVIQAAMGWTDSHLHRFLTGGDFRAPYFITKFDLEDDEDGVLEEDVRLDQLVGAVGDKLWYEYDFGDGWRHVLKVEAILDAVPERSTCLDGRRSCPPEDCGGIGGYAELAEWVRGGRDPDAVPQPFETLEHALGWLPPDWHPDAFSVAEANDALVTELAEPIAVTGELSELIESYESRGVRALGRLLSQPMWKQPAEVSDDDIALMLDPYLMLLDVVSNELKLTAAGYLPPAAVEELAERTGVSDWWIGKANREDLTYPIQELRASAQALGLLAVRKGVLRPTAVVRRAASPRTVWEQVVMRLPLGRDDFNRQAGWTALAVVGSGSPAEGWNSEISDLLSALGWRVEARRGHRPPLPSTPTVEVLETLAGRLRDRPLIGHFPAVAATARSAVLANAN